MKTPIARIGSPWKSIGVSLILASVALAPALATAEMADADSARQQAVSQYIDGATKELDAYRQEIGAAPSGTQQRLAEAKTKLAECDKLVANLKSADSSQFDLIKADYEHTRGDLVRALQAAEQK